VRGNTFVVRRREKGLALRQYFCQCSGMSDETISAYAIVNQRFRGRRDVAEVTGAAPNAVAQWYRNGIPAKFWPALVETAETRGLKDITFEALAKTKPADAEMAA
jgi:hypothetical protein